MKKVTVWGSILCVLGFVLFLIAFGLSGWDLKNLDTGEALTQRDLTRMATTRSITIEDEDADVILSVSPDDQIHLSYFENEEEMYEISGTDDLRIAHKTAGQWPLQLFQLDFYDEKRALKLAIPTAYQGVLKIETQYGDIQMAGIASGDVSLRATDGTIDLEKLQIKGTLAVDNDYGVIRLTDIKVADSIEAKTQDGKIVLSNLDAQNSISAQSQYGNIELADVAVGKKLFLKSYDSAIRGDIVGNLLDFSGTSHTEDGHNNLPETLSAGEKVLTVESEYGNIDLSFSE